ncbi:MAG: tRNA epoxyqueuosine(34) reductase QueG [Planctomycetota bacterium]|jgi:epoxyqueuosine reductase
MKTEADIKQKALELGFDAVGIMAAEPVGAPHVEYFQQWLDSGCAAKMAYMHRNIEKRFNPAKLLTGARSVICVALNYRPTQDDLIQDPPVRIARFGLYEDYHPFIKERLFQLAEFIKNEIGDGIRFKACVDSVPIPERALAQRAGLGFIGKNHMLINPELGSQFLLGELITTLEFEPDEPFEQVPCGDCGRCIRACPTGALSFDGSFDARKCISYLTIEEPDEIPSKYKDKIDNRIFGCDECILACPHELNAAERKNKDFQHHTEWQNLTPDQIQTMTEDEFQKIFADSGFIRLGLDRLKRNARISTNTNQE